MGAAPRLGVPLCAGDPFLKAEALYAIQDEQAVSLADVLVRRLRLALVTRDQGRAAAETVAGLLGAAPGLGCRRAGAGPCKSTRETWHSTPSRL